MHSKLWSSHDSLDEKARALVTRCSEGIRDNACRAADAALFASVLDGKLSSWVSAADLSRSHFYGVVTSVPMFRHTARSIYETNVAKVAAISEDLPQMMSSGGDYTRRQSAQDLTRFLEVLFKLPHGDFQTYAELTRQAYALSTVTGTVAMFPEKDRDGNISGHLDNSLTMWFERSDPNSRPLSTGRTRRFLREELLALYEDDPTLTAAIKETSCTSMGVHYDDTGKLEQKERIEVCQGWTMAIGEKPGFYMFCLKDGTVLESGEYESQAVPFALWHYYRSLDEEWGVPLLRVIIDAAIQENLALGRWVKAVHAQSQAIATSKDKKLVDALGALPDIAALHDPTGAGIQWQMPPDNPTNVNLANEMRDAAFRTSGVNEAAASSQRLGGNSGIQDRYTASLTSERYARSSRDFTQFRAVDSGWAFVRAALAVKKEHPRKKFVWRSGRRERELVLGSLDLEGADRFTLQLAATDESRDTPAGRAAMAREKLEAGEITASEYFDFLNSFDPGALDGQEDEAMKWLDEQVEEWSSIPEDELDQPDPDRVQYPEPYLPVQLLARMIKRVGFAKLEARALGASEERLDLFEQFLETTAEIAQKAAAFESSLLPQPPAAPPAPPGPPGPPVA